MRSNSFSDNRVLILAPTSKDSEVTSLILKEHGFTPKICSSLPEICEEIKNGAEAAIVTEEAVMVDKDGHLHTALAQQEPWSDFPLIVLTSATGTSKATNKSLEATGNMTLMSRPLHIATLLSHVRTALRDRKRQYRLRDYFADQKAQSQIVADAREYLELMLGSATDFAIVSLSTDGTVVKWSDGAARIFGYSEEEMVGKPLHILFTPEDLEANVPESELRAAADTGRATDERWHMRKNGERFYASGTMAAMHNPDGTLKGLVKIARDMTVQKQVEEDLIAARNAAEAANIAKTEFLANMSHEIRTPMNAVIGLSTILAATEPLTKKQTQYISTLQTSADSLLALINDLLDIAKIEARSVELEEVPFSLSRLLQEIASMLSVRAREKGLTLNGNFSSIGHKVFLGDPTRLRQIVMNLCSNAIKFTEQGAVSIDVTFAPALPKGSEQITIEVKDTGIGIPKEKIDTIFEKFTQADTSINRKYGGTGLGLAITKTLVTVMGGTVSVTSELGKGSCFIASVPMKLASHQDVQESNGSLPSIVESAKKVTRVLLVEDYEPNVLVASTILEMYGYECEVAETGYAAIEKIKTGNFNVALMDVQMPGMNGFDATIAVREFEKSNNVRRTPIIGMTAHAMAGDKERCLGAGMDDYISKPFDAAELNRKIELLVNSAFQKAFEQPHKLLKNS